uniref:Uncharacterized protein LOC114329323 n=1 Tax=Diabrotica virgifera virgifera TaxID=50390 RepID=A0A6P7FM87_DIAVI
MRTFVLNFEKSWLYIVLYYYFGCVFVKTHPVCPPRDGQESIYHPHEDCTKFWQCSNGVPYLFNCPPSLYFNTKLNVCDWPYNVQCPPPTTQPTTTLTNKPPIVTTKQPPPLTTTTQKTPWSSESTGTTDTSEITSILPSSQFTTIETSSIGTISDNTKVSISTSKATTPKITSTSTAAPNTYDTTDKSTDISSKPTISTSSKLSTLSTYVTTTSKIPTISSIKTSTSRSTLEPLTFQTTSLLTSDGSNSSSELPSTAEASTVTIPIVSSEYTSTSSPNTPKSSTLSSTQSSPTDTTRISTKSTTATSSETNTSESDSSVTTTSHTTDELDDKDTTQDRLTSSDTSKITSTTELVISSRIPQSTTSITTMLEDDITTDEFTETTDSINDTSHTTDSENIPNSSKITTPEEFIEETSTTETKEDASMTSTSTTGNDNIPSSSKTTITEEFTEEKSTAESTYSTNNQGNNTETKEDGTIISTSTTDNENIPNSSKTTITEEFREETTITEASYSTNNYDNTTETKEDESITSTTDGSTSTSIKHITSTSTETIGSESSIDISSSSIETEEDTEETITTESTYSTNHEENTTETKDESKIFTSTTDNENIPNSSQTTITEEFTEKTTTTYSINDEDITTEIKEDESMTTTSTTDGPTSTSTKHVTSASTETIGSESSVDISSSSVETEEDTVETTTKESMYSTNHEENTTETKEDETIISTSTTDNENIPNSSKSTITEEFTENITITETSYSTNNEDNTTETKEGESMASTSRTDGSTSTSTKHITSTSTETNGSESSVDISSSSIETDGNTVETTTTESTYSTNHNENTTETKEDKTIISTSTTDNENIPNSSKSTVTEESTENITITEASFSTKNEDNNTETKEDESMTSTSRTDGSASTSTKHITSTSSNVETEEYTEETITDNTSTTETSDNTVSSSSIIVDTTTFETITEKSNDMITSSITDSIASITEFYTRDSSTESDPNRTVITDETSSSSSTVVTSRPISSSRAISSSTISTTRANENLDYICQNNPGQYFLTAHPANCALYIACSFGKANIYRCSNGLWFSSGHLRCVESHLSDCKRMDTTSIISSAPFITTIIDNNENTQIICSDVNKITYNCHPEYCTKFIVCVHGVEYVMDCPSGLWFDQNLEKCVYPHNTYCFTTMLYEVTECPKVDGPDSVYYPHEDCAKFYQCSNGVPYVHNCSSGLHFNSKLNVCDYPLEAGCEEITIDYPSSPPSDDNGDKNYCLLKSFLCPPIDGSTSVYFPQQNCTKFCQCSNGVPYEHTCRDGLHFNPTLNVCDWPENAGCRGSETHTCPTITTPFTPTDSTTPNSNSCQKEGIVCPAVDGPDSVYFPLSDCTKFCQCSNGVPYEHDCPAGLHFNPKLNVCDGPQNAGCGGSDTVATEQTVTPTQDSGNNTNPTPAPNSCQKEGVVCPAVDGPDSVYFPLSDCTKFCQCSNGVPYEHDCPAGLHFNPKLNVCDWPQNAGCGGSDPVTTEQTVTPTQDSGNNTNSTPAPNSCQKEGVVCPAVDGPDSVYFPLSDCTKFCQCSNGVPYEHNCPAGLHFNPKLNVCDWPQNAGCGGSDPVTTEQTVTPTQDSGNNTNPTPAPSSCQKDSVVCPAVDGPDSVYFPLSDCTKFCQCSNGVPYEHACPAGLHFNPKLNVCDWPQNAGCGGSDPVTTEQTVTQTQDSGNNTNPTPAPSSCQKDSVVCSAVDGPDSVYFPLSDCTKFCQCSNGVPYEHACPAGLHFNPKLNVCDWPQNAGCGGSDPVTTEQTVTQTQDSGNNTNPTPAPSSCQKDSVVCPAVDGPDSVYFPLSDCTKFCQCSNGVPYEHACPAGLHFNPKLNVCDWPQNAGCGGSDPVTTEQTVTQTQDSGNNTNPTPAPNSCQKENVVCPAVDGPASVYFPLSDCTKFCQCSNGVPYEHACPAGLHFNPKLNVCDWPQNAGCGGSDPVTTEQTVTQTHNPKLNICDWPEKAGCENSDLVTTEQTVAPTPDCGNDINPTPGPNLCQKEGVVCPAVDGPDSVYFPLTDCSKFCQCSNGVPIEHTCPASLYFNPTLNVCDWPQNAGCKTAT